MYYSNTYSYFFIKNISNNINGIFYYLNSNIDYLSFIIFGTIIVILILSAIVEIYYEYISKSSLEIRTKIVNRVYTVLIISTFIFLFPNYLAQFDNHLPNFDELLFENTKDKTYTTDDLINLSEFLENKVLTLSNNFERDKDGNIKTDINYNKQAISDLKNISNQLELLKGLYPKKSSNLNNLLKGVIGSDTVGLTIPYNTFFDYTQTSTSVLGTITHEFCHTKGIARESETVYCAYLAGVNSTNELSQYAAYLEGFSRVTTALYKLDFKTSDKIEDKVMSKCLTNNYQEICQSYVKNTDEYILGTDYIYISTYHLKNYVNYQDELINSLEILVNNGATLKIDNKKISIDKIKELINNNSEKYVSIKLKLNEKKFNKIKKAFSNSNLYLSVYQENIEDEESEEMLNNPEKYYLEPFKDKDENMIINLNYGSVNYEYSRVARLLLEHYDSENN
jgi:hypothetical protein